MKKTLIAILALSGMALAITEQEAQDLLTPSGISAEALEAGTYTPTPAVSNLTIVGVVDMSKFADLWSTVKSTNRPDILTFDINTQTDTTVGLRLGETTTGSGKILYSTTYGGNLRSNWQDFDGFRNAKDGLATITLSYGAGWGTVAVLTYVNNEGALVEHHVTDWGLRFSGSNVPTVTFADIFSDVHALNQTMSVEDTLVVSKVALLGVSVPEPATATLSLLALAGLAARRRRH